MSRANPRPLSLWIGGSSLSLLGDQLYSVASAWSASAQGGAGDATAVALAVTTPRLIFMVLGGPIADRLGPPAVLLRCDSVRAVLMIVACVWVVLVGANIATLVAVGIALGTFSGLAAGASGAMIPRLVDDDQLAKANSVNMLAMRAASILGSVLAGYLIAGPGLASVMALNAASFGISFALVRSIRSYGAPQADPAAPEAPPWAMEGFAG